MKRNSSQKEVEKPAPIKPKAGHMQKSAVTRKVMVFKKTSYSMCSIARVVWFEFVLNL